MADFLEECKARLVEAQKQFQAAQQNMTMAQQVFTAKQAELNVWQGAVNTETRRRLEEENRGHKVPEKPIVIPSTPKLSSTMESAADSGTEANKTEMIRDTLRRHPAGMTPAELWKSLNGQVGRPYLYAVLKRLKDREQVAYKRKKYSLKALPSPKSEDHPRVTATLQ